MKRNTNKLAWYKKLIGGIISTIAGILIIAMTLIFIWKGIFTWLWEGVAGISIGTILLLVPESIERIIIEGLRAWGRKGNLYDEYIPEGEDKKNQGGDI